MPRTAMTTKEDILAAGKEEFLKKGFKDASLRDIAAAAGVTTGAIYGYYPDKNALFTALVEPCASHFRQRFYTAQEDFTKLPQQEQIRSMSQYSSMELAELLEYIYRHFDSFRLLVCGSAGTGYEEYLESLVEVEAKATARFVETLRQNGYNPAQLQPNLIHILSSAYFSAVFETVAHNMSKQEADEYVDQITTFFTAGWSMLLGLS